MLAPRTDKLLFIDDDSDQQSNNDQQQTKIDADKSLKNSKKIQGNFKVENQRMQKNIFHQSMQDNQQYEYQQIKYNGRRPRRTIYMPKQQNIQKTEDTPIQTNKNQQNNQSKQSKQQPESKQNTNPIKNLKPRILNFELDSDDESSGQQYQSQKLDKVKRQIEKMAQKADRAKQQCEDEQIFEQQQQQQNPQKNKNKQNEMAKKLSPTQMIENKNKYLVSMQSIPSGTYLDGSIIADNKSLNYFYPRYDLVFSGYNTHVVSCKKQSGAIGANYYISTDQQNFKKGQNYLGKVRSTSQNSVYNIFDNGSEQGNNNKKSIIATVMILTGDGPRRLQVYMLKKGVLYSSLNGSSEGDNIGLHKLYSTQSNKQKIHLFEARKPEWIPQFGKYFLNFGGKVKKASIRNFILEDKETRKKVLLFGKEDQNKWNIQIWSPLPPWIALGIIIPQFEKDD